MSRIVTSQTECPYCTSQVTIASHHDGHLEIQHAQPFGPGCESGLRRLSREGAVAGGMQLVMRNRGPGLS